MRPRTHSVFAEQRLKDLEIALPAPPTPLGAYVESLQSGNLLFLSGTLPIEAGVPRFRGRIGGDLSVEDGTAGGAARNPKRPGTGQGAFTVSESHQPGRAARRFHGDDSAV